MTDNCAPIITDPIPEHPLLAGRREIGRGESTIVVEADTVDGQERVYKILSSPTDYAYYPAPDRPTRRPSSGTPGRVDRSEPAPAVHTTCRPLAAHLPQTHRPSSRVRQD